MLLPQVGIVDVVGGIVLVPGVVVVVGIVVVTKSPHQQFPSVQKLVPALSLAFCTIVLEHMPQS